MAKALSVRLKGEEVGILRLVNGKMEFAYNPNAKHPLSMSLPIQQKPYKEKIMNYELKIAKHKII